MLDIAIGGAVGLVVNVVVAAVLGGPRPASVPTLLRGGDV
jgi:hypothetical protein